jgi:hypothetical protein
MTNAYDNGVDGGDDDEEENGQEPDNLSSSSHRYKIETLAA